MSAMSSAEMPWGTSPPCGSYRLNTEGPNGTDPGVMDAPIGVVDMTSTPAAMTMSYAPAITPWAAKWTDCCDDPHCRSIVVPGTVSGQPAPSTALRPMFRPWLPTCMTQPMITSSTSAGSRSLRSTSAFSTSAARSAGCQPESFPLRLPPAVRTASTMTAVVAMDGLLAFRAKVWSLDRSVKNATEVWPFLALPVKRW